MDDLKVKIWTHGHHAKDRIRTDKPRHTTVEVLITSYQPKRQDITATMTRPNGDSKIMRKRFRHDDVSGDVISTATGWATGTFTLFCKDKKNTKIVSLDNVLIGRKCIILLDLYLMPCSQNLQDKIGDKRYNGRKPGEEPDGKVHDHSQVAGRPPRVRPN